MTALAVNMRRRALRGDATVKISDLTRLEGAADRAHRRLALPPPGPRWAGYGPARHCRRSAARAGARPIRWRRLADDGPATIPDRRARRSIIKPSY